MEFSIKNGIEYIDEVKDLIIDYTKRLNRDLSFQGIEEELNDFPSKYTGKNGELLVAIKDNEVLGCVAYKHYNDKYCEMKRLFVKPEYGGNHIGSRLVEEITNHARSRGYKIMVLDTITPLKSAIYTYKKFGFKECKPYYNNPMDDVVYMELKL
ncbi:GNAT family N-acetyltransferase [Methanobrevibacter sp. 87.7]|uniref:GNAT family N-acetyltransferase n=1 Tax=Methanobrevibacter sp. 87.7 TaxID=387957 RepID=UPI000B504704|nr:GNAT family N-acetyltransferase [Methanobrevibacter sp. 87.7]OWT33734.1 GNAT family N-acetyltransferase [Methanobrevibacter sp. 87.7]